LFLQTLTDRNPAFIDAAVRLHQDGAIPANSYVFDLDTIEANARAFRIEADRLGLTVYAMTKQFGRNPTIMQRLALAGITAAVAVDMPCARAIAAAGLDVGHLGHLVQIPQAEQDEAASFQPRHWTVFSDDKARSAALASARASRVQDLLARIHAAGDRFYPGHEGGFPAEDIAAVADSLQALNGARFAGVTTFPALLWNPETQQVEATPNLRTVERAATALGTGLEVNAPGTTSTHVLGLLADAGATQVEPGHGLTGTTPPHAFDHELVERPAALYLTEVSHRHADRPYVFGGGMYLDRVFGDYEIKAVVATSGHREVVAAELPPPSAIDYYGQLAAGTSADVGASVVFGFRFQAFVTRAFIVPIAGVSTNQPEVVGIYGPDGRPAMWRSN
jgi:predicted amino acid racemase